MAITNEVPEPTVLENAAMLQPRTESLIAQAA
jgi:flagellar transcriptional activator FlhC